ncbi:plasmid mobilization protein, partial [Kitasatospora sp. NPDC091257]|uniref:plasmid mobilization protein n=1 Tax=Kitasatospora sp. NPDC091257 TaxID=3364084 RepID=UPI0037FFE6F2
LFYLVFVFFCVVISDPPPAPAPPRGGGPGPLLPGAAAPELHREGAAKQEETLTESRRAHAAERAEHRAVRSATPPEPRASKRRRRDNTNPKRVKIAFRVTAEQHTEIARRAAEHGLAIAAYCATKVLADDPIVGLGGRDASLDELATEVRLLRRQHAGSANNLNQLTHAFHARSQPGPDAYLEAATAVREALDEGAVLIAEVDRVATALEKAKRR